MRQQTINHPASLSRPSRSPHSSPRRTDASGLDDEISLSADTSDAIRAYLTMLAVTSGSNAEETPTDHLKEALTAVITASVA